MPKPLTVDCEACTSAIAYSQFDIKTQQIELWREAVRAHVTNLKNSSCDLPCPVRCISLPLLDGHVGRKCIISLILGVIHILCFKLQPFSSVLLCLCVLSYHKYNLSQQLEWLPACWNSAAKLIAYKLYSLWFYHNIEWASAGNIELVVLFSVGLEHWKHLAWGPCFFSIFDNSRKQASQKSSQAMHFL